MGNIVDILKASWLAKIGLAGMVVGAALMAYAAMSGLPGRGSLKAVEGQVTEALQTTRTSTRKGQGARVTGVDFTLTIAGSAGQAPLKLTIPSNEISREQVVSIVNQRVKAEDDGDSEVYALSSGGREIIGYDASIAKRSSALQVWAERGKVFLGLAAPLLLIGWFLGGRKVKKMQAQPEPAQA